VVLAKAVDHVRIEIRRNFGQAACLMSVVIDYSFGTECAETELRQTLKRLRTRIGKLKGAKPGPVRYIEPCYSALLFRELAAAGIPLPRAVASRVRQANQDDADLRRELFLSLTSVDCRRDLRFFRPALDLARSAKLWNATDYPGEFRFGGCMTYNRGGLLLEFANAMILRAYILPVRLGEGCEWMHIPLATYGPPEGALWRGGSFTKTQYAAEFTRDHENVCRILDLAQAEGLLLKAADTCGFYKHRDWRRSASIVNRETAFISGVSDLLNHAIGISRREGLPIEIVRDPIKKARNYLKGEPLDDG